jgi:hypothetical protein
MSLTAFMDCITISMGSTVSPDMPFLAIQVLMDEHAIKTSDLSLLLAAMTLATSSLFRILML